MQWHIQQQRYNGSGICSDDYNDRAPSNAACVGVSGGPSGGPSVVDFNSENNTDSENNRTLIFGPSFCGKTHLLMNKLRLIRLNDYETNSPVRQIRTITRSPEQYECIEVGGALQDVSVEENVEDLEVHRGCCVVFDHMLDSNQKLIDPFFTRGRHKLCDVYYLSQSYSDLPKKQLETIRVK